MPEVRSGFADVNGTKLYYELAGDGPTLVFTHAGVADSRMWDDQFAVFAEQYHVIRWDMRGYGQSEPPDGDFTFTHRDDLAALLRFLGVERACLIGCSMGGGASMDVAFEHPQVASALVMVCAGPGGLEIETPDPPQFAEMEVAEEAHDLERVLELEAQIWFDGQNRTPDQVDATARAKMIAMNRRAYELEPRIAGKRGPGLKPSAHERLSELHLPVLVLIGDRDIPYMQAAANYMAERIEGATKIVIPNAAHLPSLEQPALFNRLLLNFLSTLN